MTHKILYPARRRHRPGNRRRGGESVPAPGTRSGCGAGIRPARWLRGGRARRAVSRSHSPPGARGRRHSARRGRRPRWERIERSLRPERGLLAIRADLELFANLRPALLYPQLATASALKPEIVAGLDILIVRELNGDIYFGQPRGIRTLDSGEREGFNTMRYSESEIERIARVAFEAAASATASYARWTRPTCWKPPELWRDVVGRVAGDYPDVELSHIVCG